ncbi:cytochrome b/b6 domain-containing protein [Varunaivibrio sulfuroxidans]|uniref:Cytochrome b561-like protein n=1 Tax=Varunaivibrio sulfuroxidans TaxID=1773489 RepID=A0A4R3J8Y4_9PROT|nr:cytochrome b/b6 domain-containing protein [Varunaivibrio sulfuroxidans]TCS61010.1 cytochrome b561-like protein [Varunaivibrio sulfuroxidans]WES31584.1 cytochrome b/b6 domain-containing protein [Varunaivibrio sulfuroxidans]
MKRSLITRFLHLLLASSIVFQLVVTWVMRVPRPAIGRAANFGFELHQYGGLVSFTVIMLFWIWTLVRRRETSVKTLIPWFSTNERRAVIDDLKTHADALKKGRLPEPDEKSPLASAIHGLGLTIATILAVSGTFIFFSMAPNGALTALGWGAAQVHGAVANLMWAYLIAHASLAVLHQIMGHRILQRMFSVG